mmetsp:Transcript_7112/g.8796  ORF Transcript_7112/g.8796 Transcript_7112/m.8796 type:complete len:552 (-) Transcript_7112:273-1928(-)|eukprot:CAMPEP_0185753212 /NCGR_PEP_ID=MMETSP1174-20130828/11934_1 /TAXON_ID=35687 /ORGANISM="Dictyocha speculum, Strain CCMP1381" /LENGTH=551 /DNA_ID=CAMNT_0028430947 /DNA_START=70 /DNA_END=1725 /DNA_ORIENTATION=+
MKIPGVFNLILFIGISLQCPTSGFSPKNFPRTSQWSPAVGKYSLSAQALGEDLKGEEIDAKSAAAVTSITGPDDFRKTVDPANIRDNEVIAIKFWAPWCRACKALEPKYARIAQQYPNFRFKQLNWEENRAFCKEIGVAALPLVRMYSSEGQVESFTCGPKKVELLRSNLDKWKDQLGAIEPPEKGIPKAEDLTAADLKRMCPPLMAHADDEVVQRLLDNATTLNYADGDVIMEQGDYGHRFWVLLEGEVDVFKKSGYGDIADRTPWGIPVNSLYPGQYFGEHALIAGQPRWCSIVAGSPNVQCLVLEKSALQQMMPDVWANQSFVPSVWGVNVQPPKLPKKVPVKPKTTTKIVSKDHIPIIVRFRMLRTAVLAFEFAQRRTPVWGDPDQKTFRTALVASLTPAQLNEFEQIFSILDVNQTGAIQSSDLLRGLRLQGAIPENYPESKLADMINKANPNIDGNTELTKADFVAMLAEAEYSNFFMEAFAMLDTTGDGWVLAPQMVTLIRELGEESESMFSDKFMLKTMEEFGMDEDGHIDYKAFVNLMMSTR